MELEFRIPGARRHPDVDRRTGGLPEQRPSRHQDEIDAGFVGRASIDDSLPRAQPKCVHDARVGPILGALDLIASPISTFDNLHCAAFGAIIYEKVIYFY